MAAFLTGKEKEKEKKIIKKSWNDYRIMIIETLSLNSGGFDEVKPLRKYVSFKYRENSTNFEKI